MSNFLAVRAEEYVQHVSPSPFIGLPREELERHLGAISVLALEHPDAACLPLTAYAAVHYNYSWLTRFDGAASLGMGVTLKPAGETPVFLDDALHALAREQLEATGLPRAPCEWRCVGLLRDASQLALVYVVRLRQRWTDGTEPSPRILGSGELRAARASFDAFSQLLIDHLHAL